MKHIFKKTFFLIVACLLANTIWGQTNSFSATEIQAGTTKGTITVSTNFSLNTSATICKENNKNVKGTVIEGKATASTVDDSYTEIRTTTDITALRLHATTNTTSSKNMAFVYWGDGVTPAYDNTLSAALITFGDYNGDCEQNYVDVNIPDGVRIIRIYRQLKGFNGTDYDKNAKYGDGQTYYIIDLDITTQSAGPSTDATLQSLTYNGTSVPNFSADNTDYEVELPAGTTQVPTVAATATHNNAVFTITQAPGLPGMATVEVTAEDETITKTYTVTFTVASSAPKVLTATWNNQLGTAVINQVNHTITGQVTNGSTLNLAPTFTGDNISSWTPTAAQNFANSPITYTFTSATNETTTYEVTITEAPPMSSDATLSSLTVAGYTINFQPTTYTYNVELKSGTTTAPAVSYTVNDSKATATKTDATYVPGTTKIVVTAEDGTQQTYTINFTVAVPGTDLTLHEPEIYEAPTTLGGYGADLSVFSGREYEVYYSTYDNNSHLQVAVTPVRKTNGITTTTTDNYSCKANDGWFEMHATTSKSDYTISATDEFKAGESAIHKLLNDGYYQLHIKGYDQFSFFGKDNNTDASKGKHFEVYIDGILQNMTLQNSAAIRRFDITTGEHVIKIVGIGGSNNEFYGFSLRVAYTPRLKYISGNDSTQNVLQTDNIKPVTYYLKNRISDAELSWNGAEATGITLQKGTNDTLYLAGTANCRNGEYKYTISAKDENGMPVSTIEGKFNVISEVRFQRQADSIRTVYEKSAMTPIVLRYYSIDPNELTYTWTGATPAGLIFSTDADAHTLTLSGTPTTVGTFTYSVSLAAANTVNGKIIVESNSPTIVPGANKTMLYLYKTNKTDGIYNELIKSYNYFARPAGGMADGLADYSEYDFIVISEDADANNDEVLNIIRNVEKPLLNLKSQTYSTSRLGWGYPDNGSVNNTKITVLQPKHAIFTGMNATKGGTIDVLSMVSGRGLMPVRVTKPGTYALATALTQGEEYTEDGEAETFLHEVPMAERGAKYILMPVSGQSAGNLTTQGKTLLKNVINYLLSTEESVIEVPELKITRFTINGIDAGIDHNSLEISMELPYGTDLTALTPEIQTASADTYVTPGSGETIDFSDSYFGVRFTVSDYINRLVYTARVTTATGLENTELQGVRMEGNVLRNPNGIGLSIYNIQGILVGMTNNDFSFSGLPESLYLIVGEKETMKILLR